MPRQALAPSFSKVVAQIAMQRLHVSFAAAGGKTYPDVE